jgi:hypothetical protein
MQNYTFTSQVRGACAFLWSTADRLARHADPGECAALHMQLVQLRPAVLYILGQSSWHLFHAWFGAHVRRDPPISARPADRDFTLLRETCDLKHPAYLELDASPRGKQRTRLVIAPRLPEHGCVPPQFHLRPADWRKLVREQASCVAAMTPARGISVATPEDPDDYVVVQLPAEAAKARAAIAVLRDFPAAWHVLAPGYCDPRAMMAAVLDDVYERGQLSSSDRSEAAAYLARGTASDLRTP